MAATGCRPERSGAAPHPVIHPPRAGVGAPAAAPLAGLGGELRVNLGEKTEEGRIVQNARTLMEPPWCGSRRLPRGALVHQEPRRGSCSARQGNQAPASLPCCLQDLLSGLQPVRRHDRFALVRARDAIEVEREKAARTVDIRDGHRVAPSSERDQKTVSDHQIGWPCSCGSCREHQGAQADRGVLRLGEGHRTVEAPGAAWPTQN